MTPTRRNSFRSRALKTAAVGAAGFGLVLGSTPAHAHAAVALFVGTATVVPALSNPVLGAPTNGSWDFTITTGVGATAGGDVGFAVGGATGDLDEGVVQDWVGGPLGGGAFCGASGGANGTGSVTIGETTHALTDIGWKQSVGTVIFFTDANGTILDATTFGVVSAIPPTPVSGSGSCVGGTATTFQIIGGIVISS